MKNIPFHPLAEIFPLIHGKEFVELKQDIKANGVHEPIVMYQGQILDGRNRFRAAQEADVIPKFVLYEGDDPAAYVISLNLHRRHLNESQRAMVAAKLANMQLGDNQHSGSANLQSQTTRAKAAEMLNVSERTVNSAKKVEQLGAQELREKVEQGAISVSAAADIATLPKEEQAEVVAKGEKEILRAAKEIRQKKAEERREEMEQLKAESRKIALPNGKYRTIVIDPPWEMKRIQMDTRAPENEFDYPTMSVEEIKKMPMGDMAHDECHLYLWTTQKYLPAAFDIAEAWGFKYLVTMVWHKNGGFQPVGLPQYNAEFVLLCRRGGQDFEDTKQFFVCNEWPRREHSRKPDEFYDLVARVSPGPRIDVFSRERREGFDQFGNETGKFAADA